MPNRRIIVVALAVPANTIMLDAKMLCFKLIGYLRLFSSNSL